MTVLLEAKSLTKQYGSILALDSVDFEVGDGITGLLGPNGAGKSTAIKLSLGLIRPTSGSAEVMGRRPYDSPEVREQLGYMPEHDCLPPAASAAEFLSHMAQVSGLPPAQARTRAADILRHVGLEEERYRPLGQYSTGMKQRVKLGQSLVHDPVLVLLDEPTAGLDPAGREDMLRLVRRTGREFGISIILSSHLMNDVESTCDRIIVLEGGKITEEGTVAGFTADTEVIVLDVDDKREEGRHRAGRQGNKRDPGRAVNDSRNPVRGTIRRHTGLGGGNRRAPAPDESAPPPARRNLPGGPMNGPTNRQNGAEVFDLGYRHYEGLREGRARSRRAVYVNGLRTTLGIGRGTIPKVLAILMFGAAMVPAVIMAVVASLFEPAAEALPSHDDYYELVSLVLFLFAAIIGPELLCPDRRDGVIHLYLVRPITPTDYVAARWLALFTVTIALVYSGQLVLWTGLVLSASDPAEYLRENWLDIPRILGAGLVVAVFLATAPLAVAAFTERRAYAAAFVIGLFIISATISGALTACTESGSSGECEQRVTGGAAKWVSLVSVGEAPTRVNDIIFGKDDPGFGNDAGGVSTELPRPVPVLWYTLLTFGLGGLIWRRYQRIAA